jgi:hydroxymethylpyrimidine/phosphomethylpyrimidine kinase
VTRVLTITACDSEPNRDLLADLRAFHEAGVTGVAAVTAIAARSRKGAAPGADSGGDRSPRLHTVPPRFVALQIDAAVRGGGVAAVKVGDLGSWQMIAAVAERLRRRRVPNVVVDLRRLENSRAIELLHKRLLPLARVVVATEAEIEWLRETEKGAAREWPWVQWHDGLGPRDQYSAALAARLARGESE